MSKSADAFRTISEVADWLGVQTHVLRFWESKFTQVKPVKRAGGRRYYRPADMLLLGGIRKLLHDDGLTIKGVQKILREEGMAHVSDMSNPLDDDLAGQLDGDLAARVPDGDEIAALPTQTPDDEDDAPYADDDMVPDGIDHSVVKTIDASPFSQDDADADADAARSEADASAAVPSFMRSTDDIVPAPAELPPTAEPVPTLIPDFPPQDDAGMDNANAFAQAAPLEEAPTDSPAFDSAPGPFDDTGQDAPAPVADTDPAPEVAPMDIPAAASTPEPDVEMDQDSAAHAEPELAFDPLSEPAPAPDPEPAPQSLFQNFEAPPLVPPAPAPQQDVAEDASAAPEPEPEPEPPAAVDAEPDLLTPQEAHLDEASAPVQDYDPETDVEAPSDTAPVFGTARDAPPRPRIIDAPDDAPLDDADLTPSLLSKTAMLERVTPAQADAIRPLLAQLSALRDQMARSRRDPG